MSPPTYSVSLASLDAGGVPKTRTVSGADPAASYIPFDDKPYSAPSQPGYTFTFADPAEIRLMVARNVVSLYKGQSSYAKTIGIISAIVNGKASAADFGLVGSSLYGLKIPTTALPTLAALIYDPVTATASTSYTTVSAAQAIDGIGLASPLNTADPAPTSYPLHDINFLHNWVNNGFDNDRNPWIQFQLVPDTAPAVNLIGFHY